MPVKKIVATVEPIEPFELLTKPKRVYKKKEVVAPAAPIVSVAPIIEEPLKKKRAPRKKPVEP